MKFFLLLPAVAFSIISCNQKSDKMDTKNLTGDSQQSENLETCYKSVHGKDSVNLSVINYSGNITGSLLYSNAESINSSGTFTGTQSGDTLKLLARTAPAGTVSFNEIYLLTKDGKLYEGIGEVEKINDSTTVFMNPSKIDYSKSFVFNKTDCNL